MSDIKSGANVAGSTVPTTGPAAIRTTALLPGNRSSNMTTGAGGGVTGRSSSTGVGSNVSGGSNNSHNRITNHNMLSEASPRPQGSIRLDPNTRHSGIVSPSTPSTSSSSQLHKGLPMSISMSVTSPSCDNSPELSNNVGHADDQQLEEDIISTPVSDVAHILQSKNVISSRTVHNENVEKGQPAENRTSSTTNEDADEEPSRKRLKLDVNAANAARDNNSASGGSVRSHAAIRKHRTSGESLLERRKRIQEHRKSRLQRLHKSYNQNATELYYIQNHVPPGSLMDLQSFRKKPSLPFLNFLKANSAPKEFLQEVALAVLGHTDPNAVSNMVTSAGKTFENLTSSSDNSSSVQTLTIKRPTSKPMLLQQVGTNQSNKGITTFSSLEECGRVTSAAMAQAIHLERKREANPTSHVLLHPFSTFEYSNSGTTGASPQDQHYQQQLPSWPSKFPPYSPKILRGFEPGGVLYGPKLASFPPSATSSSIVPTLPTVPIAPSFHQLQVIK